MTAPTTRVSPFSLLALLMAHHRRMLGVGMAAAVVVAVITLLTPRTWTSRASFMPQARRAAPAGLGGIAAQLGVAIPGADGSQSVFFYSELIRSREVARDVVQDTFPTPAAPKATLMDRLEVTGDSPDIRLDRAIRLLQRRMGGSADPKTGIVRLTVSLGDPELSQQVATRILALVNTFNLEKRQSQARAERAFSEQRLAALRAELAQAEERLQAFLSQNRVFGPSGEATLRKERLERDVQFRRRLAEAFADTYEQAKVEEVRDTPVITVVERPERPALPDRRFLLVKTVLAFVAGSLTVALWLLGGVAFAAWRRDDAEGFAQLATQWQDARRLWRRGAGAGEG